ncbi:MAG: SRPBCC family protein [Planctomycetaceae bacterium]|nr:SRPBCC family protein [Planctomycetaceae bacterium]
MEYVTASRMIQAPVETVFATVSDIRSFSKAVDSVTRVEFLTEQQTGAGTRFRETRRMNGREHTTELEVTEYILNERVRMVSTAGGTVWDSVFTVRPVGEAAELTLVMDAEPQSMLAKVMMRLARKVVVRLLEADLDAVVQYCEQHREQSNAGGH